MVSEMADRIMRIHGRDYRVAPSMDAAVYSVYDERGVFIGWAENEDAIYTVVATWITDGRPSFVATTPDALRQFVLTVGGGGSGIATLAAGVVVGFLTALVFLSLLPALMNVWMP